MIQKISKLIDVIDSTWGGVEISYYSLISYNVYLCVIGKLMIIIHNRWFDSLRNDCPIFKNKILQIEEWVRNNHIKMVYESTSVIQQKKKSKCIVVFDNQTILCRN